MRGIKIRYGMSIGTGIILYTIKMACMFAMVVGSAAIAKAQGNEKPDILFIAIDDMNDWTTLFDKDNPIKTPNLERLAARGTFFSKGYCAVPACAPSRTAILLGYSPQTSGIYKNGDRFREMIPDAVTLPQYFKQNGYTSKGAGKIFHHGNSAHGGDPAGLSFDDFQPLLSRNFPKKKYNGFSAEMHERLDKPAYDWGEHEYLKMADVGMVEYVEKVMEEKQENPLFLAAGIFNPHLPFFAPPANFKKYPFDEVELPPMPENDLDDVPEIGKVLAHNQFWIYQHASVLPESHPGSLKKMVQSYQAAADFSDEMVGRLLDKLDVTGRADNTIIVLWSDHGYHLGDKESCVKFTLWEKATRVPFIIVAPGVTKPGSVCSTPVSLLDIYPTLVELGGLPQRDDLDGLSLVPLLENPKAKWDRPAIMTQGEGNHAIRSDRWRYIRYKDGSEELYDHKKDPWEWTNLAGKKKYQKIIEEHKKWLPKN